MQNFNQFSLFKLLLPIRVAGITGAAFVNIPGYIIVFIIHFRLTVFVAENAFENRKIILVHMAIRACIPLISMLTGINRKIQLIMIPVCLIPCCGVVARFALGGKSGCRMIRIGCALIIVHVATHTHRWRTGITARMTVITG